MLFCLSLPHLSSHFAPFKMRNSLRDALVPASSIKPRLALDGMKKQKGELSTGSTLIARYARARNHNTRHMRLIVHLILKSHFHSAAPGAPGCWGGSRSGLDWCDVAGFIPGSSQILHCCPEDTGKDETVKLVLFLWCSRVDYCHQR